MIPRNCAPNLRPSRTVSQRITDDPSGLDAQSVAGHLWITIRRQDDELKSHGSLRRLGQRDRQAPRSEIINQRISTSRARLDDPNKPIGVLCWWTKRRRQTGTRTLRLAVRWERNRSHQYVRVQEAHTVSTENRPGIRRLRRRRCADEGRPPAVVLGRPAGQRGKAHPDV
jgi:hypothetical protein